jgi:predicted small metal-binding protein
MGMDDGFMAKGEAEQEVMDKMMEHVKEMHPDMMEGKSDEDIVKLKEDMRMKMKDEM